MIPAQQKLLDHPENKLLTGLPMQERDRLLPHLEAGELAVRRSPV